MKKLLLSLFVLTGLSSSAQYLAFDYARSHTAPVGSQVSIKAIKSDIAGSQYIIGMYSDTFDIDPGVGVEMITPLTTANRYFIQKLDNLGNQVWNISDFEYELSDLAFNNSGEIYVAATVNATATQMDIDPSLNTVNVDFLGKEDILIFKINASGNIVSGAAYGLLDQNENSPKIAVDNNGDIIFSAYASYFADNYGMIVKLNLDLTIVWQKSLSGVGKCNITAMDVDPYNNLYFGGYHLGSIDFDPNGGIQESTTPLYTWKKFVVKLSGAGDFTWVNLVSGNSNNLKATDLKVDDLGNVYQTGWQRSVAIDYNANNPGVSVLTVPSSQVRTFIHKINANGSHGWARFQKDLNSETGNGKFIGLGLNQSPIVSSYYPSNDNFENSIVVTAIDNNGNNLYELLEPKHTNYLFAMNVKSNGNVYLGGGLGYATLYFNNNADSIVGSASSFLIKYYQCGAETPITSIGGLSTACAGTSFTFTAGGVADNVDWTLPSDWTITTGSGTNTITGTYGQIAGAVSVKATNRCNLSTTYSSGLVTPSVGLPSQPQSLTPSDPHCLDDDFYVSLSPPPTPGDGTIWSWSSDPWTITYSDLYAELSLNSISSGSVTVVVNNACGSSAPFTQSFNFALDARLPDPIITETGGIISTNSVAAEYCWYEINSESEFCFTGSAGMNFTPTSSGDYYLVISTANGCASASNTISVTVQETTSINEKSLGSFNIFPNPAKEIITINNLIIGSTIQLIDITGKIILEKSVSSSEINLDLGLVKNGIYFLELRDNSSLIVTKKLVVNK